MPSKINSVEVGMKIKAEIIREFAAEFSKWLSYCAIALDDRQIKEFNLISNNLEKGIVKALQATAQAAGERWEKHSNTCSFCGKDYQIYGHRICSDCDIKFTEEHFGSLNKEIITKDKQIAEQEEKIKELEDGEQMAISVIADLQAKLKAQSQKVAELEAEVLKLQGGGL
jgi:hypothetical protein